MATVKKPAPPAPPSDLGDAGLVIYASVTERYDINAEERAVLLSACRTADVIDTLQKAVDRDGVIVDGRSNPLLVELRQQRILIARLVAALRIPDDEDTDTRPQRRGAPRGTYGGRR